MFRSAAAPFLSGTPSGANRGWFARLAKLTPIQSAPPQAPVLHAMCGHVLHTTFPMTGLPICAETAGPLGSILVRPGETPQRLAAGVQLESGVDVSDREVLIWVRDGGRILVRDGREIIVDLQAGVGRNLQPFILGTGLAAACLQKGLLSLHASAVGRAGESIAFAGASGAGKSTMAAAMIARGYDHLSDDLSVLRLPGKGRAELYSSVPLVKLWPDSASAVGLDDRDAKSELSWHAKLMFDMPAAAASSSTRLAAIYFLEREDRADIVIERLVGHYALSALAREIYRRAWLTPMGRLEEVLQQVAQLSRRTPCFRVGRPHRFDQLHQVAQTIADHHASLTAVQGSAA